MASHDSLTGSEIAVVGMAARLPGADTLQEFWHNLRSGVESIRRFTEAELLDAGESASVIADPDYVRASPALANVDQFDAAFFGMSPQDAKIMDPQHRLFLEVGWEAIENAGHDPGRFPGSVGVFATCGMNTYMMYHLVTNRRIMDTVGEWLVRHTGNDMNFLATRLSYQLGLKGPSMNVQTACSSALVAIHLASQSLLNAECDMALAGGSVIALPQNRGYLYKKGEILSPDGHCRTFDARAAGTLFGSGAGVVVLRRLADAIADGDQVLAVVRGSAVNNDGAMRVGYLAPGVEGQARAITEALAVSGVHPETISYVEAHGTATLVGDPIEIAALTEAYRQYTDKREYCAIGSLKSNIGHLGEAAGVAGFIKTVLSLQHRQMPPSLHFDTPNPEIDFASSPFFVNASLREWVSKETPRRAAITALGAGGTNCHVILEEAPPQAASSSPSDAAELLVLSAKTATALDAAAARLATHLESEPGLDLSDVAYTLQVGRQVLTHRRALVCHGRDEAIQLLRARAHVAATAESKASPVVFLFPGGGAQYPDMGVGLYRTKSVFREAVDRCLAILSQRHDVDLRPILFPHSTARDEAARQLERSTHSILSVFTIEYALAQLWTSWGVRPAAMTGHSVGEYAAACVAGVVSLDDALAIVHARGTIFERLAPGAMLSVPLSEADVVPLLRGGLCLAAVNAPALCVVSGPVDQIAVLERDLAARGLEVRRLPISVAAHSSMLDPHLDEFRRRVASVRLSPPSVPFISNLTGQWIRPEEATDPGYWVRHLRQTVRFGDGLAHLLERPGQVLLEVGPGRTLGSLARQQPAQPAAVVSSIRHRDEEVADDRFLLAAAGRLWEHGAGPDWIAFHAGSRRRRVALPTYPFERRRHWVAAGQPMAAAVSVAAPADPIPRRERDMADWFFRPTWSSTAAPLPSREVDGDLLVFDDASGLGRAIVDEIRRNAGALNDTSSNVWRLEFPTPGETQGATFAQVARATPETAEIEIAVRTAALNFADALKVSGVQPDAPFGMECAGIVTRVGDSVSTVAVGDEVVAIGPNSFQTHVVRDARLVAKKPPTLSWADAATIPAAFMTAVHALEAVSGLQAGERVLIHAASGGVGLAAVQVAKARGAEIFATAGSPDKRALLESLGIRHVFHSRTPEFADAIRRATGGAGMDVVLNSLTGELLARSLELLAPGGRFVEIGKKEIFSQQEIAARGLAPDVRYHAVDLTRIMRDDPAAYGELLAGVIRRVATGAFQPLPSRLFRAADAGPAFELMIQAKHTGKIVLDFEARGPRVWFVEAGARFEQLEPGRFSIAPARANDYTALFDALGESVKSLRRVLHLWNVETGGDHRQLLDAQLERSFFSPLRIAQTIGRQELMQPIDITWVSSGVHRVAGESSVDAAKATLQGPSRVIPRELPNVACRHVDVEPPIAPWQRVRLVRQLAGEISAPIADDTIAFRGGDRWVQRYTRLRAEPSAPLPTSRGAHLITGGFGGLGLEIAERLAAAGSRQIALVGRTAVPPRQEWETWLEHHGADDPTSHRIRKLLACEALGADLLLLTGDVADRDQIGRAVAEARTRFGRIAGVFHTAGALADGLIQLKIDDTTLDVLKPKVHGTLALHDALADAPPDFMVLFSSISAVLGLQGQVDYVAANAFLDAFAHAHAAGPTRVVSANWCAWRGVGLAASASHARHQTTPAAATATIHPWLERRRKSAGTTTFTTTFDRARQWVVGEHVTRGGDALMPGTGYLELARAAVATLADDPSLELSHVYFHAPFVVQPDEGRDLDVTIIPSADGYDWRVQSAAGTHASGKAYSVEAVPERRMDVSEVRDRCPRVERFDQGVSDQQFMAFGPRWANLVECRYGDEESLVSLALRAEFRSEVETFRLHPALLDMATGGAQKLIAGFDPAAHFYVPFSYGRVLMLGALPSTIVSHVRLVPGTGDGLALFDVTIVDEQGRVLVEIVDFCMKRVGVDELVRGEGTTQADLQDDPRPVETSAELAEEMLRLGITATEGLNALDRILAAPATPQVVVSSVDIGTWQAILARQTRAAAAVAAPQEGHEPVPSVSSPTGAADQSIEARVASIWSEILGVPHVGYDENFFELGGHSLLAVRLLARLERIFDRVISMPALFATPTIAGLAAILRAVSSNTRSLEPALLPIARDRLRRSRKLPV
jgi:acyl transferase domain-containing protein/NADPH:quinone reductase-like Zn-dependent oxidoreductase/acyl carrier protein